MRGAILRILPFFKRAVILRDSRRTEEAKRISWIRDGVIFSIYTARHHEIG